MEGYFFKKRNKLDFRANKFDLGNPFWQTNSHLDMLFLNKIGKLDSSILENFYNYHLHYYIKTQTNAKEEIFFRKVYFLVESERGKELNKEPRKMNPRKKNKYDKRLENYDFFLKMMESKDDWGVLKSENEIKEINELRKEVVRLKSELSKYRVKPEHKIEIIDNDKDTIIDLFHQMQELKQWEPSKKDKELLRTHSQNTWAKILANYFTVGNEEISFHTAKKHFQLHQIGRYAEKNNYEIKIKKD